jgi:hypothetical protein
MVRWRVGCGTPSETKHIRSCKHSRQREQGARHMVCTEVGLVLRPSLIASVSSTTTGRFFKFYFMGWHYVSELLPLADILVIPRWYMESDGGIILTGKNRRTWRKTCPSVTLSATNPTSIYPGTNPGLRGERPPTNRLSHGTAMGGNTMKTNSGIMCNISVAALSGNLPRRSLRLRRVLIRRMDADKIVGASLRWKIWDKAWCCK